jgi:hypothetical protein
MMRRALLKLLVAFMIFIGLLLGIFSKGDRGLVGIMGGLLVVVVLPVTVLLSIDASRIIKRETSESRSLRGFGVLLGIPQAIMGIVLVAFGLVYPFFGIRALLADSATGLPGFIDLVLTLTAFALLFVGYHYVREGLGLKGRDHKSR